MVLCASLCDDLSNTFVYESPLPSARRAGGCVCALKVRLWSNMGRLYYYFFTFSAFVKLFYSSMLIMCAQLATIIRWDIRQCSRFSRLAHTQTCSVCSVCIARSYFSCSMSAGMVLRHGKMICNLNRFFVSLHFCCFCGCCCCCCCFLGVLQCGFIPWQSCTICRLLNSINCTITVYGWIMAEPMIVENAVIVACKSNASTDDIGKHEFRFDWTILKVKRETKWQRHIVMNISHDHSNEIHSRRSVCVTYL